MIDLIKGPAMASSRPTTSKLTKDILFKLMEVGANGPSSVHSVVEKLLSEGLVARKPKVLNSCSSIILEAAQCFGASRLPLGSVANSASKMLAHSNATVRDAGINIIAEICRATGSKQPMQTVIDAMKSSQLSQLDHLLESQPNPTTSTLRLRSEVGLPSSSPEDVLAALEASTKAQEAERFASREAVNIFSLLPKTDYKIKMKLPKWSEKVAAIKLLIECGGEKPFKLVPPSTDAPYNILISDLKLLLDHTHFAVNASAMDALSMLATGVGEKLSPLLRPFVPLLIDKSKDKKVLAAVNKCLDDFYGNVLSLPALLEADFLPMFLNEKKQKNPISRATAISFLFRSLQRYYDSGFDSSCLDIYKKVAVLTADKLSDTDPNLRKLAVEVLNYLVEIEEVEIKNQTKSIIDEIKSSNPRAFKVLMTGKKPITKESRKQENLMANVPNGNLDKIPAKGSKSSNPRSLDSPPSNEMIGLQPSLDDALSKLRACSIPGWMTSESNEGIEDGIKCKSLIFTSIPVFLVLYFLNFSS